MILGECSYLVATDAAVYIDKAVLLRARTTVLVIDDLLERRTATTGSIGHIDV